MEQFQAAHIERVPNRSQAVAPVYAAKRVNRTARISRHQTPRPSAFRLPQQGRKTGNIYSRHVAGQDQIKLTPSAVKCRLDAPKWSKSWPQIGETLDSETGIALWRPNQCYISRCGANLGGDVLNQTPRFYRQQRFIAPHPAAQTPYQYESRRLHAQIVALKEAFSRYNANKTRFVAFAQSLTRFMLRLPGIVPVFLASALPAFISAQVRPSTQPRVDAIRFWSFGDVTRVAIQTHGIYKLATDQVETPSRLYFDLSGLLPPPTAHHGTQTIQVGDHRLKQIRVAEVSPGKTRIVFDLEGPVEVVSSQLVNPDRLMIELRPKETSLPALSVSRSITVARQVDVYSEPPANQSLISSPTTAGKPPLEAEPVTETCTSTVSSSTSRPAMSSCVVGDDTPTPRQSNVSAVPSVIPPAPIALSRSDRVLGPAAPAKRDSSGDRSLVRLFGLKMGKVVIDAGHGGHDTGTIGRNGLLEKDLVLDVALRLGKLITKQLGAEVVYTRTDNTFIPLEARTKMANDEKADLFISIHANSSPEPSATGVETYFFNLSSDRAGLDLATRENATSASSISDLNDLLHRAVLQTKLEESREFAQRVQASLWASSVRMNSRSRDRGVRQAPFVVLIGATMPSILAEIGFVSNPHDERLLKRSDQRQKIAEALYKGVSQYASSLSHVQLARAGSE